MLDKAKALNPCKDQGIGLSGKAVKVLKAERVSVDFGAFKYSWEGMRL